MSNQDTKIPVRTLMVTRMAKMSSVSRRSHVIKRKEQLEQVPTVVITRPQLPHRYINFLSVHGEANRSSTFGLFWTMYLLERQYSSYKLPYLRFKYAETNFAVVFDVANMVQRSEIDSSWPILSKMSSGITGIILNFFFKNFFAGAALRSPSQGLQIFLKQDDELCGCLAVQFFFAFINKMKAVLLVTSITLTLIVFLIFSRSSVIIKQNFEKVKMVGMSTCDKTREQLKSLDRTRVIPCMLDKEVIVNGITIPVCGDNDFIDIKTFPQWMKEDNTPIGSGIKSVREIKNLNKELYLKAPKEVEAQWEIRIISFQQKHPLLEMFRDMFPDVPSRIQRAVNVRGIPIYK